MLVVLEKKPLTGSQQGPTITFTDRDVQIYDQVIANNGSNAPVAAGWKLTERQAIETTMLPSANNYAESLAIWAYGSVPKFLTAAKAFLQAHRPDPHDARRLERARPGRQEHAERPRRARRARPRERGARADRGRAERDGAADRLAHEHERAARSGRCRRDEDRHDRPGRRVPAVQREGDGGRAARRAGGRDPRRGLASAARRDRAGPAEERRCGPARGTAVDEGGALRDLPHEVGRHREGRRRAPTRRCSSGASST